MKLVITVGEFTKEEAEAFKTVMQYNIKASGVPVPDGFVYTIEVVE